jgi:hypothetical protein
VLAELPEADATGEIARVYAEIRRLWAVPYVSSMQRHLATRPGWLEWVWGALGPAFETGRAQTAAWRVVDDLDLPRLAPIARDALRVWGVDPAGEAAIGAVCDSFVRVSPVNLVLSGLLRRLLRGDRPAGVAPERPAWRPPPALPPLPPLADAASLPPATRAVMTSLGTSAGDAPFVPGLYRMLARWPAFLAHLAIVLPPRLREPATRALFDEVNERIDAEVPAIFAALPPLPRHPAMPPQADAGDVRAALDTYRKTSPEMVVVGRMIRRALPG